ncbi:MAG: DUF1015 domain-containing protein [Flavobacteriales bacterium]|nr:DUF1015 domain-containing protein [Flavobacteriales bacterium]MBP9080136.1 DUF1015 domain-containing protein [Flavobacteriales bacterium]
MIRVFPFRAWRPAVHTAHLVGSRSFVQYSPAQLREKLAGNPYTFLHIVHADHDLQGLSRAEHFDAVRNKFMAFTAEGILEREAGPAFYLYEQSCGAFLSHGLICAVDVADYREGRIKVHEQTLVAREELFTEYLDHTGINAEPVLLAMPDAAALEAQLQQVAQGPALFDFCTTDRVRHRFWKLDAPEEIARVQAHLGRTPALYIADGHHRCASSALLAQRAHAAPGTPKAAFLAFIVPDKHLYIYNYDRVVKGLNGLSPQQLLAALRQVGALVELHGGTEPPAPGHVHLFLAEKWYRLSLPVDASATVVDALDAALLSQQVLGPVLGITDLRTDPRIRFVPGTHGRQALEEEVRSGKADMAFHLAAVTFGQLQAVADSGASMPPKTTWIEPKLRSGLTIYSLEDA